MIDIIDPDIKVTKVSLAELPYLRPRIAGKNARLDVHGFGGSVPIAQIKAGNWAGFGWCHVSNEDAELLVGTSVKDMLTETGILKKEYRKFEFPILDLLGNILNKPVYKLIGNSDDIKEFSVPVYDTTIYFDELSIEDDDKAVAFICSEVEEGLKMGHRNFKVKIGRCGMWMPIDKGLKRDIAIIHEIRKLVGSEACLMVDANNGYNLNLTKAFLESTANDNIYWLEEAFHEDEVLYTYLREWMRENGIETMIADGEGDASPNIVGWAKKGIIDVLQYDLKGYGFFNWLELCKDLQDYDVLYAPHNYGGYYGNFAQAHFAASTPKFAFAEFDVAKAEGINDSAYSIKEGRLIVPEINGFGLELDEKVFQ